MQRQPFAPMFFLGLASVLLLNLEAVYAQSSAVRTVANNGDDFFKILATVGAGFMTLLTENPLLTLTILILGVFGIGAIAKRS